MSPLTLDADILSAGQGNRYVFASLSYIRLLLTFILPRFILANTEQPHRKTAVTSHRIPAARRRVSNSPTDGFCGTSPLASRSNSDLERWSRPPRRTAERSSRSTHSAHRHSEIPEMSNMLGDLQAPRYVSPLSPPYPASQNMMYIRPP
jgi:hypothetical protein